MVAAAIILLIGASVGVANLAEGTDTVAPPISGAPATGLAAADTTAASTTLRNDIPIIPGSDEESVATLEALPHPGVAVLTETSLTDAIADQGRSARSAHGRGRSGPPIRLRVQRLRRESRVLGPSRRQGSRVSLCRLPVAWITAAILRRVFRLRRGRASADRLFATGLSATPVSPYA